MPPLKHPGKVTTVTSFFCRNAAFSPDGRRIATLAFERTDQGRVGHLCLWNAQTGEQVGSPFVAREERGGQSDVGRVGTPPLWFRHVAFSPDSRRVGVVTLDGMAHILDANNGALLVSLPKLKGELVRVAFSPDARRVLTEGTGKAARIWDAATGGPLTPLLRNVGYYGYSSFSANGRTILTPTWSGWPQVWDADLGQPITPYLPRRHYAAYGELSLNGCRVLMTCNDGRTRVFEIGSENRPVEDLSALARVLSGQEIDANGGLAPLAPAALSTAWQSLRIKYPDALSSQPDEALTWHLSEAEDAASARQWSAALLHLDQVIKVRPTNRLYLARRGYAHAALANWEAAATDFSEAVKLGVEDRRVLRACALTQLAAGDFEAYRKTCAALLKTLDAPDGLRAGPGVVLIGLLGARAPAELEGLQAFIERGTSHPAWAPHYRLPTGMLLYRTQRFKEALAELSETASVSDKKGLSAAWPLLAMAHFRLEQMEQARESLARARKEFEAEAEPKSGEGIFEPPRWERRLILELLLREAQELIPAQTN